MMSILLYLSTLFSVQGTVSYYVHGKITANGEKYNPNNVSVAFYTDPKNKRQHLGKTVKITNIENGKFIYAKVNDNGSFLEKYGRIGDLSWGAFKALGGTKKKGLLRNIQIEY